MPVSSNVVAVQLNANELANDPANRNGFLHGQTVYVDSRVVAAGGNRGTAVADVSGGIGAVPQTVAQLTSKGGQVSLQSEGDVVVAQGSRINVSGGQTNYTGGTVATTQLIGANGKVYDIGKASADLAYVGLINPTTSQTYAGWGVTKTQTTPGTGHYEAGYTQGSSAGTLQVAAPNIVLNGTLLGSAYNGPYQRTAATRNPGGTLIIGMQTPIPGSNGLSDYFAPAVQFSAQAPVIVVEDGAPFPGQQILNLPTTYLTEGGFTQTEIYSNQSVVLPQNLPLTLAAGSSLLLSAPNIDIRSSITAPGGKLQFSTADTVDVFGGTGPQREAINIESDVSLNVSGLWTNDALGATGVLAAGQTTRDGGSIALLLGGIGGVLELGDNSSLVANGGAWLSSARALTGGSGGSITLDAGAVGSALEIGNNVALAAFGVQGAAGGSFSLTTDRIEISKGTSWSAAQTVDDLNAPGGVLQLSSGLFSNYGFGSVTLTATGPTGGKSPTDDVLVLDPGTTVLAQEQSFQFSGNYLTRATGTSIADFATVVTLPDYLRPVESVALNFAPAGTDIPDFNGRISIGQGASILADPTAKISLSSVGSIDIDGTLRALGGTISASTVANTNQINPLSGQGIRLGSAAVLDASGTSIYQPSRADLRFGSVLPGGTVKLQANVGGLVLEPGSLIDVAGIAAPLDVMTSTGQYALQTVGSAGGAVSIGSSGALALSGAVDAAAAVGANLRAAGGSLTVGLLGSAFPSGTRILEINDAPAASVIGVPPDSAVSIVSAPWLEASGADSLTLTATYGPRSYPRTPRPMAR